MGRIDAKVVPIVVGVVVGVVLALLPNSIVSHSTSGPPLDDCYCITVALVPSGSFQSVGEVHYNFTVSFMAQPNATTTSWTQFYGYSGSLTNAIPLIVTLFNQLGNKLADFNSTQSSWKGGYVGYNNSTIPTMGGWVSGSGAPVVINDWFEVTVAQSMPVGTLYALFAAPLAPHRIAEANLALGS